MSKQTRERVAYWFTLVLGIAINSVQFYKYFTDTLEFNFSEIIVFGAGILLMFAPRVLSQAFGKIAKNYANDADHTRK